MLRRLSAAVADVAVPARCVGLSVYSSKADINMKKFDMDDEYANFRAKSEQFPDLNMKNYRASFWRIDEYVRRAQAFMDKQGYFYLPTLDFAPHKGCLPLFSAYQLRLHYGRHHRTYVDKLNSLVKGTELDGVPLDDLIARTRNDARYTGVFNNAAQHFNHCFFWKSIVPHGSNCPPDLQAALEKQYGSLQAFEKAFIDAALALFGSGWVYLVWDTNANQFDLVSYSNAGCPAGVPGVTPLLCVDVWEHAYYVDYENNRAQFMSKFFSVVDWHWAERHWKRATGQEYNEIRWS